MVYLPIWFQAIRVNAVQSGMRSLPLILGFVVMTIIGGGVVTTYGYYAPCMILSSVLMAIGAGLLTTLDAESHSSQWIGYQILLGFGVGLGLQQALIAVQTVLPLKDVPSGTAIVIFAQSLGSAVFLSVGQTVFTNSLTAGLKRAAPTLDPKVVLAIGATDLKDVVLPQFSSAVFLAYNQALAKTYYVTIGTACLSLLGSLWIEWKSAKSKSV